MEIRKKIIYGIFAVSAVYGFYFHFISENRVERDSAENVRPPGRPIVAANPSVLGTAAAAVDDSAIDWARDPFRNPRYGKGQANKNVDSRRKLTLPQLTAISRTGGKSMAVVNGQIIEIGNTIGPWRLIRIAPNAALFEGPDGPVWVKLGG